MPFVTKENRDKLAQGLPPEAPGDLCYLEYKKMVEAWKKSPRWTTWHNLVKDGFNLTDEQTAKILAFAVFFLWEIENYELQKEIENGPID